MQSKEVQKLRVRVFSTSACPFCSMAKDFLNEHNMPFEDVNVEKNHEAAHEMIEKSGQMGVPVIIISEDTAKVKTAKNKVAKSKSAKSEAAKETVIVGFDAAKLKKALKIKE